MNVSSQDPELADIERHDNLARLIQEYYEGKDQLRRGLCLLAAGRYDDAVRALTHAARANSPSTSLPKYLAAAYAGQGRLEQAADEYAKLLDREPEDVVDRVRHALTLWKAGRIAAATASFREGLGRNPESAELEFQLATLLADQGETEEAELHFKQAVTLDKHHAEAMAGLALCRGAKGEVREAVRWLTRAQAENPHDARTALLLTYALKADVDTHPGAVRPAMPGAISSRDEAAIDELATVIEAEPDFVEALFSLDPDRVDSEVFAMLAAIINRALERSPEHADLHYHCGRVLAHQGRTGDAISAVERAIALRPHFVKALITLAKLYCKGNRHLDARRRLLKAIRLGAEYADVYCLLGNLYRDGGMLEPARRAYQRAIDINPNYADARHALLAVSV